MSEAEFVEIAVDAPLHKPLTYRLPSVLSSQVQLGSQVLVPLGKRKSRGVVLTRSKKLPHLNETKAKTDKVRVYKDVEEVLTTPALGEKSRQWLKWLGQYYLHPPGQVFALAFAPGDETRKRKSTKSSPTGDMSKIPQTSAPTPNIEQRDAITAITQSSEKNIFETFLLFGVTGSGKTEVYLQSIDEVLKKGKQVLVLVPEISLTPQLITRFVGRFGENVAVIHSHLTPREKSDQWWDVVRGKKKILVGARSALFCPTENLGLIVVDEEHEASFKQEEQLKYNARDAAIVRAQIAQCPIVLGSATPSLESWQNAQNGKFKLLELKKRVEDRPLPIVKVVDLRLTKVQRDRPQREGGLPFWLSPELHEELKLALKEKDQSALFLNRRGFAQFVMCPGCGHSEQCPQCTVSLTAHKKGALLTCHYCGFEKALPEKCPACREFQLKPLGLGTEKVCDELALLFPQARIARADRDEIKTREDLEDLLNKINANEVDIIVGTQMIAKGHDFPNLTLVGIVLADVGLHFPDLRSSERTFQLLTQVAGRAGRHQKPGRVIVQTYMPEHPAVDCATTHDFKKFAKQELEMRRELSYPPFGKLAIIRLQGPSLPKVEEAAAMTAQRIDQLKAQLAKQNPTFEKIEVLGPVESALAKLRNKFRFHVLLKETSAKSLNIFLQHLGSNLEWLPSGVKMSVDIDPLQFM